MPKRIQLSRKKGYRKPDGAIVVSRPSRFGNPWSIKKARESGLFKPEYCAQVVVDEYEAWLTKSISPNSEHLGRWHELEEQRQWILDHLHELRGHDLACWCKPGEPCHADILLELANA